VNIELYIVVSR